MPQLQFTIDDFTQASRWTGYRIYTEPNTYYTQYSTPSTATIEKEYDISLIPAGAVIDQAILSQARNDPYTGIFLRRVDAEAWTGSRDVTSKLQAMGGVYDTVSFAFQFRANGGAGGTSVGGTQITSTLQATSNTLTVTYHMPTSAGTLDKQTVDAGGSVKVTISPAEAGRTHRAVWTFGGHSLDSGILPAATLEHTLNIPLDWLDAIPNATAGAAGCRLETYDGDTPLGYREYPFTISCPSFVVPSFTFPAPTHIPHSSAVAGWGYVQGYSKAALAITEAAGPYGSTIASRNIIGAGYDSDGAGSLETGIISQQGTVTFTARVTDNRGRTKTETQSINVAAYEKPTFLAVITERCNAAGVLDVAGTYARAYCEYEHTAIGGNAVVATVQYREAGASPWSAAVPIGNGVGVTIGNGSFDASKTYEVLYTISDALATRTYQDYISKAQYLAEFGKDAVGLLTTYGPEGTVTVRAGAVLRNGETPYLMQGDAINAQSLDSHQASYFQKALAAGDCIGLNGNVISALGLYAHGTTANGWYIKLGTAAGGIMIQGKRINTTTGQFTTWNDRVYYKDIDFGAWDTAFAALWDVLPGVSDNVQFWPTNSVLSDNGVLSASKTQAGTWRLESGTSPSKTGNVTVIGIGTY